MIVKKCPHCGKFVSNRNLITKEKYTMHIPKYHYLNTGRTSYGYTKRQALLEAAVIAVAALPVVVLGLFILFTTPKPWNINDITSTQVSHPHSQHPLYK